MDVLAGKLENNSIIVYPTDTVWGIGSSILSHAGYEGIHRIKGSSEMKPMSILFPAIPKLSEWFDLSKIERKVALEDFFQCESTLLLPLAWAKKAIPPYVYGESKHVGVRCLPFPFLGECFSALEAPIFTTSLNLTGTPPITEESEAVKFFKGHIEDKYQSIMISSKGVELSGNSSTIILVNESGEYRIVREGTHVSKLRTTFGL